MSRVQRLKGDCPVSVDIATYKAEFLSHYFEGLPRPRAAYALGLINHWAKLASFAPGFANLFTQTPGLREDWQSSQPACPGNATSRHLLQQPFKTGLNENGPPHSNLGGGLCSGRIH